MRRAIFLLAALVVTLALLPPAPAVAATPVASGNPAVTGVIHYTDEDGRWAQGYIDHETRKTFAFGFTDLSFRPDQAISRLDAAIMLVRALGLEGWAQRELQAGRTASFMDITSLSPLQQSYLATAQALGLMIGSDGQFRPSDPLTRTEAATVVVRAMGLEQRAKALSPTNLTYTDAGSVPEWGKPYVQVATETGIVVGYPDKTFRPLRDVTRAEYVTILDRVDLQVQGSGDSVETLGLVTQAAADGQFSAKVGGAVAVVKLAPDAHIATRSADGKLSLASTSAVTADQYARWITANNAAVYVELDGSAQPAAATRRVITGTFTMIDADASRLTMHMDDGTDGTLDVAMGATVTVDGQTAQWTDLVAGERLMANAERENGVWVVTEVRAEGK